MSTTHHVKMAKASQKDIDGAIELYQFLRAMSSGRSCPEVVDEFGYKGYEDLLERDAVDVEFALRAHERGDLFRVVWGLQVLLDPRNEVVDPNLPHLELHPKHEQAAKERDEARAQLAAVTAQRDALVKATGGFVDAFDGHGAFDGLFWGADSWMTAMRDALQAALRPTASAQPEQPQQPPTQQPAVAEPTIQSGECSFVGMPKTIERVGMPKDIARMVRLGEISIKAVSEEE